jgi:hypothetical protein
MPTGYTIAVEEGCSFNEFVWSCARGFGALVTLRDDIKAKIPLKLEYSPYHTVKLKELDAELMALQKPNFAKIEKIIANKNKEISERNKRYIEEHNVKIKRYAEMKQKISEWIPPTLEHNNLKDFMLQQIDVSINFEGKPYQQPLVEILPAAWLELEKARLLKDIEYHTQRHNEEVKRVDERNEWLKALRESVPVPE